MANQLDEMDESLINDDGRDINVISKRIEANVGSGSKAFEIFMWVPLIIPGIVFASMKASAGNYFRALEQRIQRNASTIDNYLENRVNILTNCAKLLDKSIDLDKTTFAKIAELRSGNSADKEVNRNEMQAQLDNVSKSINIAVERYPDLKAHEQIKEAMQQNMYLQREITAARELYNDTVGEWNENLLKWPVKMIVAAKNGYTTRIPFTASKEIKEQASGVFF